MALPQVARRIGWFPAKPAPAPGDRAIDSPAQRAIVPNGRCLHRPRSCKTGQKMPMARP